MDDRARPPKHRVPFDFAQGRLSTPQIIAFAMISSGRDDRAGNVHRSQTWTNKQTRLSTCHRRASRSCNLSIRFRVHAEPPESRSLSHRNDREQHKLRCQIQSPTRGTPSRILRLDAHSEDALRALSLLAELPGLHAGLHPGFWGLRSHGDGPHPAARPATKSVVAFWRSGVLARFECGQPGIGFFGGGVEAGRLVMRPGAERILPKLLALLFALNVLLDGFAHDPVRGTAAGHGEALYALLGFGIELHAGCRRFWHSGALRCYLLILYHPVPLRFAIGRATRRPPKRSQNPARSAYVESHSCAKDAQEWGTEPSWSVQIFYSRKSAGSPLLIAARTLAISVSRSPKSAGSMAS